MKTPSILKTAFITAGFSAFILIGSAQAQVLNTDQVVNVSFGTANNLNGTSYGSTVSPLAYVGNVWNEVASVTTGVSDLNYSDSTLGASKIGFTQSGIFAAPSGATGASLTLLNDSFYNFSGNPGTFTINGLNNSSTYDIGIASQFPSSFSDNFTLVGGGTQSTTPIPSSTWVDGQNYVEFDNVAPTSGAISFIVTSTAADTPPILLINGFQIGAVTPPVEAPEPSTYALLGLGALALLVISRRHRKA